MLKVKKVYKHITIYLDEEQQVYDKPVYIVINTKNEDVLGYIYYEQKWNQYVFTSQPDIIFSVSCLQDIIDFIENKI